MSPEIEASVIASLKHKDRTALGRRSDAIVELMVAARQAEGPLTKGTLWEWHRLLFFGIEVEDLGRWRQFEIEIVRSAAAGSNDILYKAPPPDEVDAEMVAFIDWLNDKPELPVPIVAAIAHLWFESIHPFSDGNGRVGRALIEYVFASRSRALPFSLSRQIEKDKKAYYAALQEGRKVGRRAIDATAFIVWFLDTLKSAADAGRDEAQFLVRRNQFFLQFSDVISERQMSVLRTLFAQGEGRLKQGLSAKSYSKIAKVSGPTATRDLGAMERTGALRRSESGGRSYGLLDQLLRFRQPWHVAMTRSGRVGERAGTYFVCLATTVCTWSAQAAIAERFSDEYVARLYTPATPAL